ncbi:MAG: class I SAM-dependent RNA methyltransferase [Oscillospiraceae bacterium]|nr:class I SAM-dependent RNA methyltransferase [Oscillospiraceae bacterium]
MQQLNLTAPCHFGLEKTLAFEVKRAGGENIETTDGRVNFTGSPEVLINANLTCSVAERIGVIIGTFKAENFDDVFNNLKKCSMIGELMGSANSAFPVVKGQSVNSKLTSIPALQRTVKKALVEALKAFYKTTHLPETGATYPVRFFLHKNMITVFVDSSGDGLHKRGYRRYSGDAPIKETLAAGIVDIAKIRRGELIIDPFCGSGTILIEATLKALKIPVGLNRRFISENWSITPQEMWNTKREQFRSEIATREQNSNFRAIGYDIDPECVKLTLQNAKKAGVEKYVSAEVRAIGDFLYDEPQNYEYTAHKIITNPPYAERMLEKTDTTRIYREMGKVLNPVGGEIYVITSDEEFEDLFGRKAHKNRKLYNGMLMCRLYMYRKN